MLHPAAAMYSASAVDRAIVDCLLLDHEIRFSPRNWQLPEVLLRSTLCRPSVLPFYLPLLFPECTWDALESLMAYILRDQISSEVL